MTEFGSSLSGGTLGSTGGGGFFKPDTYLGAYAFLVEPTSYTPDAPGFDPGSTRQLLRGTVTLWASPEALDAGQPTILTDITIDKPYLAGDLKNSVGKAEVLKLATRPNGQGKRPSWVWRPVNPEAIAKIVEYVKQRDAQPEAAAVEADPWAEVA